MKIKIKYKYIQKFIPSKRHKNKRTRLLEDVVTVNIKELTAPEFPLAFVVHDFGSIYPDMKSYDDYERVKDNGIYGVYAEELRMHNNKLYKPVRINHGSALSNIFEIPEEYAKRNIEWAMCRLTYGFNDNRDEFTDNSVIISDNKADRRKYARDKAKGYVVYDGKVWIECSEPRYVICTFGLGHNHGGTGFFIEYTYTPTIGKQNYFNALQYDEAVAYGKAVAARRGDTESIDRIGNCSGTKQFIEVIMPEMVKCCPNKDHVDGNEFINSINELIDNSDSALEAGVLFMALASIPDSALNNKKE